MLHVTGKIRTIVFAACLGVAAAPVLAQSGNELSGLKPYDAPLAPPANGLARVIRSENQNQAGQQRKFKPAGGLTVTIGGFAEMGVGSTTRR